MKRRFSIAAVLVLLLAAATYYYRARTPVALSADELRLRKLAPFSPLVGQQVLNVALTIVKVSPTTFGYEVTVKVQNVGTEAAFLALGGPSDAPWLQSLDVQQFTPVLGWQSVGPCHDLPPYTTRLLAPGETTQGVIPIGDTCHGFTSTPCHGRIEHLAGEIRAGLYWVYASDAEFRQRLTTPLSRREFASQSLRIPAPVHAAALDQCPTSSVPPIYPAAAKKAKIQGRVLLEVAVAEDGSVSDVTVLGGPKILAAAAADAVRQWRYRPYSRKENLVQTHRTVSIKFGIP